MAETKIEWCDYTFNPWTGCTKVSPGCANCYAEPIAQRFSLGSWGPSGVRKIASESYWEQPFRWNRAAAKAGERRKVFCASMADVFEERPELREPRLRMFSIIGKTRHLDWLLLTKRPHFAFEHWPLFAGYWAGVMPKEYWQEISDGGRPTPTEMPNVWLGVSVEDQKRADERIPLLLQTPASLRFASVEPLLGPVNLRMLGGLDWVIVGGESGPKARPCNVEWIRSIIRQCEAANVACFVKQLGSRPLRRREVILDDGQSLDDLLPQHSVATGKSLRDRKGGDPSEWPDDLRVRQFPEVGLFTKGET